MRVCISETDLKSCSHPEVQLQSQFASLCRCLWTAVRGCCPSSFTPSFWMTLMVHGESRSRPTFRTSSAFVAEALRPPVGLRRLSTLTLVGLEMCLVFVITCQHSDCEWHHIQLLCIIIDCCFRVRHCQQGFVWQDFSAHHACCYWLSEAPAETTGGREVHNVFVIRNVSNETFQSLWTIKTNISSLDS